MALFPWCGRGIARLETEASLPDNRQPDGAKQSIRCCRGGTESSAAGAASRPAAGPACPTRRPRTPSRRSSATTIRSSTATAWRSSTIATTPRTPCRRRWPRRWVRCPGEEREIEVRPWLFRVAHNESVSLLRKRRAGGGPATSESCRCSASRRRRSSRPAIACAASSTDLGELPERQRSAIVMRELSGLSYPEIGAALSCSQGGARQAVYEARSALGSARKVATWTVRMSAWRSPIATAGGSAAASSAPT